MRYFKETQSNTQITKYDCSICLIIRDESEYLEEWLRWHIGQGVEHFYIYDHDSKIPRRSNLFDRANDHIASAS
ncbi:MAG: glycosyltransferase family 2 protein [Firmicutes bacterium]|nr:glycosyltransferase family 2 protein [Bacillota bacterium]